jgi:hypothetical protein
MKKIILSFTLLIVFITCFSQIDYKGFPQWSWRKQDSTEYYLYTPSVESKDSLYPIALFLHGCCGTSYQATLRNTVDPPARMWHNFGANKQKVPTYIISAATSRGWKQHIPNLKKVMDDLVKNHRGDPKRIYISGFSMGANGTWEFLQQYPDYFAAAFPMGMNFHGDHNQIKDIPIWTNRGETDYWARDLHKDVWEIRKLNGNDVDSNENWVTGTNPRFTSFKGIDHGVQWIAASSQDLTGWAYTKVNDGNKYPTVFFRSPSYKKSTTEGAVVPVEIVAIDPDGTISKVMVHVNGKHLATLSKAPFNINITAPEGDTKLEAIAFDNKGKTSTATTIIRTDINTRMLSNVLPYARKGALYEKKLLANGNGEIVFSVAAGSKLPAGLKLSGNGILSGVPVETGDFDFNISAKDEDGDSLSRRFDLSVLGKMPGEIIITNSVNDSGVAFPVSKMRYGVQTHINLSDDEVTVSDAGVYEGMSFIPGNISDTARTSANYLSFVVDEDATVYVAYEKKDHLFNCTIPAWLKEFKKSPSQQITAQYFHYDVYYKDFPKGRILLPGADEKRNNVTNNYFVLVKKQLAPHQFNPEINTTKLSEAKSNQIYREQLTTLYGTGVTNWKLVKGNLPKGITLGEYGMLEGKAAVKGSYKFTLRATDERGNAAQKEFVLDVN